MYLFSVTGVHRFTLYLKLRGVTWCEITTYISVIVTQGILGMQGEPGDKGEMGKKVNKDDIYECVPSFSLFVNAVY